MKLEQIHFNNNMFIWANVKVIKVCSVYTSRWLTVSHTYVFYNDYRKRKKTLIFRCKCVGNMSNYKADCICITSHIQIYTDRQHIYGQNTHGCVLKIETNTYDIHIILR